MKQKFIKDMILGIPVGVMTVVTACPDPGEDYADKGSEAAIKFCECYKKNTEEKCLDNLKDHYSSYTYESDDFIEAFNETSTCGIELVLIQE